MNSAGLAERRAWDDRFWLEEADQRGDIFDLGVGHDVCLDLIVGRFGKRLDLGGSLSFLEIGCGVGRLTVPLSLRFPEAVVLGVDINPAFIMKADRLAEQRESAAIHLDRSCLWSSNFDGYFDGVYSVAVFQHIDDLRKREYVDRSFQVLRPGGVMVVQWVEGSAVSRCMYDARTDDVRSWAVSAGFGVVSVEHDVLFPRWSWMTAEKKR